ncbi:bile acid:sodium symporter family protein [Neptunomonas japonica]|uniref:Bile acid:Na+ symporter, BASS family n=1 Tax=Neptunomonas japonica JAMM 1380 TaxID=1441457 RepID=A0A7R6PJ49_9GAMM|nr:bile acid:sodium symporter family protein [Neptunomonas japonica]BBB29201.1 bile acid:Na+ symporter, BASS family [Neptunomonas japonica JAMM 1380]
MESTALTQVVLPLALFFIMLGIGLSLDVSNFLDLKSRPLAVVLGSVLQLVVLPLLGYSVVTLLNVPPAYAVGIMILTFAPGGATSNMISYLSRADTALSVSLTVIASVVTPFTLPLLSFMAVSHWLSLDTTVAFPIVLTIFKLLTIALLPVILGMWLNHKAPYFSAKLQLAVKWCSLLFMLAVVVGIVSGNKDKLSGMLVEVGPVIILLSFAAMLIGWWAGKLFRLPAKQGVTLAIETGIQNAGLALMITGAVLHNTEMSGVVLLYGVLMQVPAILLIVCCHWQWKQSAAVKNIKSFKL